MKYIIDRIESDKVICENQENKKMEEFKKIMFPEKIREGDIVILNENKFTIEENETKDRKEYINDLMKKLMKG